MARLANSPRVQAPLRSSSALLILDMLSDFRFPDGERFFRAALPVAHRVAALKRRAQRAGIPVIYVNDNYGRWRSDLSGMLRQCEKAGDSAATIVELLKPGNEDLVVLKPRHSGFYATALDTLLGYIEARTLILTGMSAHQCVLFTANDAYVREYALCIPRDCIAASSRAATTFALRYFKTVLGADTRPAAQLRMRSA